ncbi:MAG: hypothetical protein RBR86_07185 [Pseudobdellovibrionaceae bacterium]|jgi:hypothetical protein|nr:hypothetical protein [Pseudobdellovibrionaceae bacterium]
MRRISKKAIFFTSLFAILAVVALARDLYAWDRDNIYPRGDLGGIFKLYLPDAYHSVVDFLGADLFNAVLTPILSIPAFLLALGLCIFSFALGYGCSRFSKNYIPPKKKGAEAGTLKDRVRYQRR